MQDETLEKSAEQAEFADDLQMEAEQEQDEKKKRPAVWLAVLSSIRSEVSFLKATSLKELHEAIKHLDLGTEVSELYRAVPKQFQVKTTVTKKLEIV
jgi:hypothetical protein